LATDSRCPETPRRWEERRKIIHATDFIPDKRVVDACYSIGPIGSIVAVDALSYLQFSRKKKGVAKMRDVNRV